MTNPLTDVIGLREGSALEYKLRGRTSAYWWEDAG